MLCYTDGHCLKKRAKQLLRAVVRSHMQAVLVAQPPSASQHAKTQKAYHLYSICSQCCRFPWTEGRWFAEAPACLLTSLFSLQCYAMDPLSPMPFKQQKQVQILGSFGRMLCVCSSLCCRRQLAKMYAHFQVNIGKLLIEMTQAICSCCVLLHLPSTAAASPACRLQLLLPKQRNRGACWWSCGLVIGVIAVANTAQICCCQTQRNADPHFGSGKLLGCLQLICHNQQNRDELSSVLSMHYLNRCSHTVCWRLLVLEGNQDQVASWPPVRSAMELLLEGLPTPKQPVQPPERVLRNSVKWPLSASSSSIRAESRSSLWPRITTLRQGCDSHNKASQNNLRLRHPRYTDGEGRIAVNNSPCNADDIASRSQTVQFLQQVGWVRRRLARAP